MRCVEITSLCVITFRSVADAHSAHGTNRPNLARVCWDILGASFREIPHQTSGNLRLSDAPRSVHHARVGIAATLEGAGMMPRTRLTDDLAEGRRRHILIVDDDSAARSLLAQLLEDKGFTTTTLASGEDGLRALEADLYDVVLLDLNLPRMQGLSVLAAATSLQLDAQFIVMTALGSIDTAVEAIKLGACDYIAKPFRAAELLLAVERACADTELRREVAHLRRRVPTDARSRMVGRSPPMERLFDMIERVAPMRASVLVTGETGTGKELVARAIHALSGRAKRPFIAVNCSALPETLLESELFGHVKGSFTGAIASKRGLIEEAAGGTLFLDEISTISAHIQVMLLRVLEERRIQRVGSTQSAPVDFRLIAASNDHLEQRVSEGTFREDLFYRLNVFPIRVPPLRERRGDVPLLANYFRLRFAEENGVQPPELSHATLSHMMNYDWPGNVRELENFVERAVILYAGSREIRFEPPSGQRRREQELVKRAAGSDWDLERLETEYILTILEQTHGHQGRAAEILGINRRTLYRKLRALGKPYTDADSSRQSSEARPTILAGMVSTTDWKDARETQLRPSRSRNPGVGRSGAGAEDQARAARRWAGLQTASPG